MAPAGNRRRRRRLLLGGIAATVLVVAALTVALWPRSTADQGAAAAAGGRGSATTTRTVDACATWNVTEQTPTPPDLAIAPSVTWSLVGGIAAPSAPATGPASESPVRWCYAPTAGGALVALSNFYAQQQDKSISRTDLLTHTVADTPSREYALAEAATRPVTGEPPDRQNPKLRGFRFVSYTAESASIDLVHEWKGQLVSGVYELHYESGDWRVVLPPSWEFPLRVISSTTDMDTSYYTPWGP